MLTGKNVMIIGFVVGVFVVLQGLLIFVGKVDSPVETAVDFTKAYFMLDGDSMTELLCREIVENEEVDIVDEYLNSVAVRARLMGFSKNYMRNQLSHVTTETEITDGNKAKVTISGERLRSINPVFALIGRLFFLIESHEFHGTLTLVKENDQWKVCNKPFSLSEI